MRALPACLLCLSWLVAAPAVAAPPSAQKRLERRNEAEDVVKMVLEGKTSVPAAISRLRYLREEAWAAELLVRQIPSLLEPRSLRDATAVLAGLEVPGAEPVLARLAANPDGPVRMYAVQGLGKVRSKRFDVLITLLEDKTSGVRREAARALGAARVARVSRNLLAAAKKETEVEVRAVMLEAVGATGDASAVNPLKEFLKSDSESTRFAAARGLCLLNSKDGLDQARKLLESQDRFVRRQGLALLEGLPAKTTDSILRPLLQDKDRTVAAISARILYQGGDKAMVDWLVLASANAKGDEKLAYEKELESFQLADDQRKAILRKAGVLK